MPSIAPPSPSWWAPARWQTRIVVSSSWREGATRGSFAPLAEANGIPACLLHEDWATPVLRDNRQREIDAWLQRHIEVTDWAILDDGVGLDEDSPRWIHTDYDDGPQFDHALCLGALLDLDVGEWMERAGLQFGNGDRQRVANWRSLVTTARRDGDQPPPA